ncbi:uracil-DNA glycosylase [Metabacillus fastidiosus]|uniref:uracil-DNA glycosylase n=1 Tax=Metabacillus fastidiosus TaxID=1458 RepID=UPI002E2409DB|nr:uracil-DNA glycosylase [Metabacillus fastidiosus]
MVKRESPVNCITCKYFYVTWDPKFPNGCKAYGFKSAARPSVSVRRASGMDCLKYEKKNG